MYWDSSLCGYLSESCTKKSKRVPTEFLQAYVTCKTVRLCLWLCIVCNGEARKYVTVINLKLSVCVSEIKCYVCAGQEIVPQYL
jgi:hypothetical protein